MAEESFQEKTEPATGKKREEARKKGQVARSMDINSAFALIVGMMILYVGGKGLAGSLASTAREFFEGASVYRINAVTMHSLFVQMLWRTLLMLAPIMLGLMVVGLAANFAQVGFMFSMETLEPKWGKINPLNGLQKVFFSRRSIVELLKNLLKIGIVGLVAYGALDNIMTDSLPLMDGDADGVLGFMGRASMALGLKMGVAFLVLAVLDHFYQRFEYEKQMRMTKEEVKEETKQLEGDPQVKSRVRSIQRRIAYKRMMQDVPKATVVVTNPTHVAVALKYDTEEMSAPKVVAKGAELIAKRIKEIALEHGVPIVEDKPLARALYRSVEVGDEIPEKLFQAVAQVLAYIYRLKNIKPLYN